MGHNIIVPRFQQYPPKSEIEIMEEINETLKNIAVILSKKNG